MAKMVLKSYEEINRERKRLRIILIVASLPFLVVIGLFATKASLMYINAQNSINHFNEKEYVASSDYAEKQKVTNFLEQWLAYYNSGTALSAEGKYEESISDLNKALNLVQGNIPNECYVRANLSLTYEKYGDKFTADNDTLNADKSYLASSHIVDEAPPECFPPSSGGSSSDEKTSETGESMEETKERSDSKTSGGSSEEPSEQPSEEPAENESENQAQSDRDKIQEQMDNSDADRKEDEAAQGDSSTKPNSKPW